MVCIEIAMGKNNWQKTRVTKLTEYKKLKRLIFEVSQTKIQIQIQIQLETKKKLVNSNIPELNKTTTRGEKKKTEEAM